VLTNTNEVKRWYTGQSAAPNRSRWTEIAQIDASARGRLTNGTATFDGDHQGRFEVANEVNGESNTKRGFENLSYRDLRPNTGLNQNVQDARII